MYFLTSYTHQSGTFDTLKAIVFPVDAANKAVRWSIGDPALVSMSSDGAVLAGTTPGVTNITATSIDGGKTAVCRVTVLDIFSNGHRNIQAMSLNKHSIPALFVNTFDTLTVTVQPEEAIAEILWTSSDPLVAFLPVSPSSIAVRGVTAGSTTITATTVHGGRTDICSVTVLSIPVTGVSLNKTSATILVNATETLTATVSPPNATDKAVSWTSNNPAVATVLNGTVTARAAGTADITVSAADGSYTATCHVTVPVPVAGVSLNKTSATLYIGSTETLTATVSPNNAANKTISWTSDNPAVADVVNGTVTAKSAGTAKITVTAADGGKTAECRVTVIPVLVADVSLNKNSVTLPVNASETLAATVSPGNATNQAVTWTSDNESVAGVSSDGTVTAKSAGTADITVTTESEGKTAVCRVTVIVPVTGVSLNKTSAALYIATTETLTATVSPPNATDKAVTWTSSNTAVATVSGEGSICKVTAVGEGSARITVAAAGGSLTAAYQVTVTAPPVAGVNLKSSTIVHVGTSLTLMADVQPAAAKNKTVKWSIDDTSVAGIKPNGQECEITGKNVGETRITVTTEEGNKTAVCHVAVTVPASGVSLDRPSAILPVGASMTLTADIQPANVTNRSVIWTNGNPSVVSILPDKLSCTVTALAPGEVWLTVTAPDGSRTPAMCRVTVKVDATLKNLTVAEYRGERAVFPLSPVFDPDHFNYRVYIPSHISQIVVDGEKHNPETYVDGIGIVYGLNTDDRDIKIQVFTVNQNHGSTYTVTATRDINTVLTDIPRVAPPEVQVYAGGSGVLHVNSPISETVRVYTVTGTLLHSAQKPVGKTSLAVNHPQRILIVRGGSGWTRKLTMDN
jgi:uncharacterized protein YjdB